MMSRVRALAGLCLMAVAGITPMAQAQGPGESILPQAATDHMLSAGTPITLSLDEDLSSSTAKVGDRFAVTVVDDVVRDGTVVVPKGTHGSGEVTLAVDRGGFGRVGMLGIALHHLDLDGRQIPLDGRYREEGRNREGAVAVTMFAVGAVAGFIKGGSSVIPMGRHLRGRIGGDVSIVPESPIAAPPATDQKATPIAVSAPAPDTAISLQPTTFVTPK